MAINTKPSIKAVESLIKTIKDLKGEVNTIDQVSVSSLKKLDDAMVTVKKTGGLTAKEFYNLSDATYKAMMSGTELTRYIDLTTEKLAKSTSMVKASSEAKKADAEASKKLTSRMVESVNTIGKKSKALKNLAGQYKEEEAAIQKEIKAQKKSTKEQELSTKATTKANKEKIKETDYINRNKAALDKQRQAYLKSNKAKGTEISGGGSSFPKLSNIAKYTGLAGIFTAATAAARKFVLEVIDVTKKMDSIRFAARATITDLTELGQTEEWLLEISNNYGAAIDVTTNRYLKFRAAADAAGLSVKETQQIFETMTKVSGVLGLSTDELRGIYLALEQMISKGKITTEELRRQLGERLPGAMDIMAKSMGVSTAELDKMMKKGEVMTKDVLPAFAVEVEKSFGLDSIDKIRTLAAVSARYQNAWTLFVEDMGSDGSIIRESYLAVLDFTTGILQSLTDIEGKIKDVFSSDRIKLEKQAVKDYEKVYDNMYKTLNNQEKGQKKLLAARMQETGEVERMNKLLKENVDEEYRRKDILEFMANNSVPKILSEMNDEASIFHDLSNAEKGRLLIMKARLDAAKQIKEEALEESEITVRRRTVDVIDEDIAEVTKLRSKNSAIRAEWVKFTKELEDLQDERERITGKKTKGSGKAKIDTSEIDIRIEQSKRFIEIEKAISDDTDRELATRLDAQKRVADESLTLLTLEYFKKRKLADGHKGKLMLIEQQYAFDQDRLAEENTNKLVKINEDELKRIKDLKEARTNELLEIDKKYYEDLTELRENYTGQELEDKETALTVQYDKNTLEAGIAYLTAMVKVLKEAGVSTLELETALKDLESQLAKTGKEAGYSFKDKLVEALMKVNEAFASINDFAQAIFDRNIENIEAEIVAVEDKYDRLISAAQYNNDEQIRLEEERDAQIKELEDKRLKEEQKAARWRKAQAIVDIAISTAIGIAQATGKGPLGWWEIPIIAALGAIQTATVLAQPIPQYADGLENAETDHVAMINDGVKNGKMVKEYVERNGQILSSDTRNAIVGLKKGDTVHKDYDSMVDSKMHILDIVKATTMANVQSQSKGKDVTVVLDEQLGNMKKDIKSGIRQGFNNVKLISKTSIDAKWIVFKNNTL